MAKSKKQAPAPARIEVREASMFGVVEDPEQAMIDAAEGRDWFYMDGYTDKRQAWEEAKVAWERGGRHGPPPAPLDFRLQCVSVERADGRPDGRKVGEWVGKGYRKLKWDEAKGLGLNVEDTQWTKDADGNVRNASQVVMIADRATAARNAARVAQDQASQEAAIEARLADAAARYNRARGHKADGGTAFGPFTIENPDDAN